MTVRRIILVITGAIGLFVGVWGAIWPQAFYDAFPGFGRVWIAIDGPYNEHLILGVALLLPGPRQITHHERKESQ